VGSFGPLDPERRSPGYGRITTTPKPGWANTDVAGPLGEALGLPVAFDTDVNAAALGEARWGCAQGLENFLYLTIGTGIGGGAITEGRILHGLVHPEMGHILIPHDFALEPFAGICPYHRDCLEGLASGPAIQARWGKPAEELPREHPAWELVAHYLALALANFVCTLSPERIALGGGVMKQRQLFPMIRAKLQTTLNRYVQAPEILTEIDTYVVPPALGDRAGVLGAIALARQIVES
jgi:fructokinase